MARPRDGDGTRKGNPPDVGEVGISGRPNGEGREYSGLWDCPFVSLDETNGVCPEKCPSKKNLFVIKIILLTDYLIEIIYLESEYR